MNISEENAVADVLKLALENPCTTRSGSNSGPKIAVVNSFMEYSPGDAHLKDLAEYVKSGIREAGGQSIEIFIPGFCGELKKNSEVRKYYFAYRDFATAMVEFLVGFHDFQGAVFMCTCDNQVPAFIMGALRVNVPCVFVTGGYMAPGIFRGEEITAFEAAKRYGKFKNGECSRKDLEEIVKSACPGCGACPEMGTANTMCILTEVLGLSLPGNSTAPAQSDRLSEIAFQAGKEAVRCANEKRYPKQIVTESAIKNAIRVCLGIGGSTNAVIHTIAIAKEIGADISLDTWDRFSDETPFICSISPNQKGKYLNRLDKAGGVRTVLKIMESVLDVSQRNVQNITMKEYLKDTATVESDILRSLKNPFANEGGLKVLKGNLAPAGGILKVSASGSGLREFNGPAVVFDCEEDAMKAVLSGNVKKGSVIVVRYEGPSAGPGSRECVGIMHAVAGLGMLDQIALVTDGRLSGTNLGMAVCNISPEAVTGTALAIVQDGDTIHIDIDRKRLDVLLGEAEIQLRLSKWKPPHPRIKSGILALYAKNVGQLSEGARII